jgi:hypothetical protein
MINKLKGLKILILLMILSLLSCINNSDHKCKSTNDFIKDIPIVHNKLPLDYVYVLQISDQLNLPDISNGYDSLQIRVWFPSENEGNHMVLILDRAATKWNMKMYEFLADYSNQVPKIISYKRLSAQPKNSWEVIINSIDEIKILEVKDFRQIKNYNYNSTHSVYYSFEVATCSSYRYFEIADPEKNSAIPEAKKVLEFINLLKSQIEY